MTTPAESLRFNGLAEIYAAHRPGYPSAARDALVHTASLGPDTLVVDVGCGTGISARWLAEVGIPVLGIEPNPEMLAQARRQVVPNVDYRQGRADATGVDTGIAAAVLCGQAFHWFANDRTLREFQRVLRPGGWAALIWNERDPRDACTAAYGEIVRAAPEAATIETARAESGRVLLDCPWFEAGRVERFAATQELDEDGLVGRALSVSYAPVNPVLRESYVAGVRSVFATFQRAGRVTLVYETSLYLARRAE